MQIMHDWVTWRSRGLLIVALALLAAALSSTAAHAQIVQQAVGGVLIDSDGVLRTAQAADQAALAKQMQAIEKVPGDLNVPAEMKKISLRRLEAALDDCTQNKKPIPDAIKYLGGLQHVRFVLVYPEQQDIVLVGPSEGWKVDAKGNVVGAATGRPVMQLDDLLVALRTAKAAAQGGISCSIDPTPEGIARMRAVSRGNDRETVVHEMESAMGTQRISVHGVPDSSHFARVLVAADYHMKRLSMNLDASPVRGLTSYLQMVRPTSGRALTPRFWLEPKYEALYRDADGLAWELRGSGVKVMTEEDFLAATGDMQHSGKASRTAQAWADNMTSKYAELTVADPIYGELQNCMELAIVGALIVKDRLTEKAGHSLPTLMESPAVKTEVFNAPKQVESVASVVVKGQDWIVGVSGGVAINSWGIADKAKVSETVAPVRAKAAPTENTNWWWN